MYLVLILLPIIGSIVSGFFGRKVGISGSQLITCISVITTTILAIVAFIEIGLNNILVTTNMIKWIDVESLNILWGFSFDSLTVSMLIPVLIVSSLVHVYSIGYMSHDPHNQRFFSYLSLFTFMMIILVTANSFLLMFVGWEGVGICSYLLVCFWFTRIAANQSSISAFLTNRVGDCFLTIGMFSILWSFGNIDYNTVFSISPYFNENIITILGICLLIGAMAKSSQVGLHVWLPMAMEGPTPVSALIHAATMVTAGVYLLMRISPLIEYSSTVLILCLWIGAITTVFSSLVGLFQQDIKKVIAYSTMSQLGMMVIAVGLSTYNVALFHLVNHAFYKALLFLGAGAVIHGVADNQDFRKYGGLISYLPLTYSVMLIASFSLVAIPFMTGFYSKDLILESAYGLYNLSSIIVYFIAIIGAMFTTLYSVKVLYLTFLSNPNGPLVNYKQAKAAHEGDIFISMPLIILAVFSIFFGYLNKDIFIGLASGFFSDNSLFIHPFHEIMLDIEFAVPVLYKLLPLFFTIFLSIIFLLFTDFYPKLLINFKFSNFGYNIFSFLNQRFYIELFYNKYISGIILKLGGQTTEDMDEGLVELVGPYGIKKSLINLSIKIDKLSTGIVTSYALYILIGLICYICVFYYLTSVSFLQILFLILLSLIYLLNITFRPNSIVRLATFGAPFFTFHLIVPSAGDYLTGGWESLIISIAGAAFVYVSMETIMRIDPPVEEQPNWGLLEPLWNRLPFPYDQYNSFHPAPRDPIVALDQPTTTTNNLSNEFLESHVREFGNNRLFDNEYFDNMRELANSFFDLHELHDRLIFWYDNLSKFFIENIHPCLISLSNLPDLLSSIELLQICGGATGEKAIIFTALVGAFNDVLLNYNVIIKKIGTLLEAVSRVNPSFYLGHPRLPHIFITPLIWYVLIMYPEISLDSSVFHSGWPIDMDPTTDYYQQLSDLLATQNRFIRPDMNTVLNEYFQNYGTEFPFSGVRDCIGNQLFEIEKLARK